MSESMRDQDRNTEIDHYPIQDSAGSKTDLSAYPGNPRVGRAFVLAIIAVFVVIGSLVAWNTGAVDHVSTGEQTKTFIIDVDFDRFRQILVRKNGTESIVAHSGMKLLDQRIEDIEIDTSGDDRPLRNAIRGKSKTEVSAVKHLTVQLVDTSLDADKLELRQVAEIEPREIQVTTTSTEPAGKLEKYNSTLLARPSGKTTELTVTVDIAVRTKIPKLFAKNADRKVQQAADDAVANQAEAMTRFFNEHADEPVILPDLGNL